MKTIDVDARRYVWCQSQALWRASMPITAVLEDLRGALEEGQEGLVRHSARSIGQNCAVVLNLVTYYERPIPSNRMRAAWALERVREHPLGRDCLTLMRSPADLTAAQLAEIAERLVREVHALVGRVPNPLSPDGYFPALATARDWLNFADFVGEEGFLPREWTDQEAH